MSLLLIQGLLGRDRRVDLLPVGTCPVVSGIGMTGISISSPAGLERAFHSLAARRVELIEPNRVNVPIAKTEIVTIDSIASATMFELKRLST